MLYEALAGHAPFSGPNLPAILRAALRGECAPLPAEVSPACRELVAALLQPDPERRLGLEAALAHPWLARGLEGRRELSPLPSEEEGEQLAAAGQGEGNGGEHAATADGEALPTGPAAGHMGVRPGSSCGHGSMPRSQSHSSLELLLPGGSALPPVAEEASCTRVGDQGAGGSGGSGNEARERASGSPTAAARLPRGRSLDTQRRPDGASLVSRLSKSQSSKSLGIAARAGAAAVAAPSPTARPVAGR